MFLFIPAALAVPIPVGDAAKLDVGGLVQTQLQLTEAGAPDGESVGTDLFLRRVRLVVTGGIGDHWSFALLTDSPNLGKGGDWAGRILVQEAMVSGRVNRAFGVDAGLLLLPFTHHGLQGATSLNALDYHASVMLYPAGSTQIWRDAGFQARGHVLHDRLAYRVGVYNGVEGIPGVDASGAALPVANPHDWPRFAGQLRFNLAGVEDKPWLGGIYFTETPIVSLGVSGMVQPEGAGLDADATTWSAVGGDVFADVPVGKDMELVAQAEVVHYGAGEGAVTSGTGGFVELGYRIGVIEPIVSAEGFLSDADASDTYALKVGAAGWIKRHTANVKAEVQLAGLGELADIKPTWTATVQTQLSF